MDSMYAEDSMHSVYSMHSAFPEKIPPFVTSSPHAGRQLDDRTVEKQKTRAAQPSKFTRQQKLQIMNVVCWRWRHNLCGASPVPDPHQTKSAVRKSHPQVHTFA
jgi:hypothetical protein